MHKLGQPHTIKPLLRSLIQKSVRRGDIQLVEMVACKLAEQGDSEWLRTRAGIIAFEECWPYGEKIHHTPALIALSEIAGMKKNKNAAGLGSLAHALASGDMSTLAIAPDPIALKIVAASLTRSPEFFEWAAQNGKGHSQSCLIEAARIYFSRASWPWDKAFASAAAYFASNGTTLSLECTPEAQAAEYKCPLWVAADKHTPTGKLALRRVAYKIEIPFEQLEWASFYFESAFCNSVYEGEWWNAEMSWRFNKLKLNIDEARTLWERAREYVQDEVSEDVKSLNSLLEIN